MEFPPGFILVILQESGETPFSALGLFTGATDTAHGLADLLSLYLYPLCVPHGRHIDTRIHTTQPQFWTMLMWICLLL